MNTNAKPSFVLNDDDKAVLETVLTQLDIFPESLFIPAPFSVSQLTSALNGSEPISLHQLLASAHFGFLPIPSSYRAFCNHAERINRVRPIWDALELLNDPLGRENEAAREFGFHTTLSRAIAVMRVFLAEFKRMFDPIDDTPKSIKDAWRVARYLYEHNWVPNNLPASYNDVLQGRAVREGGGDFDAAINHLVNIGYVVADKSERKKFIRLNPIAFGKLTAKSFEGPIPESFYRAPSPYCGEPRRQGPLPFMGGLFSGQIHH